MAIDIGFSIYAKWVHEKQNDDSTKHRLILDITFDREHEFEFYEEKIERNERGDETVKQNKKAENDNVFILKKNNEAVVGTKILYKVNEKRDYKRKTISIKFLEKDNGQQERLVDYETPIINDKEVKLEIWEHELHSHYQELLKLKREEDKSIIRDKLDSIIKSIKSIFGNTMGLSISSSLEEIEKITHQRGHTTVIIGSGG